MGDTDRIDVEVTLGEDKRVVDIFYVEVFVCDVVHSAISDVFTSPGFESGSVLQIIVSANGHIFISISSR